MKRIAFVLLAGCGGAPNQPLLANAPRPNPAYVAGGAAAAAAAITLASPDATRTPEKNQDVEKAPIKVKENVPADVFDRLDHKSADAPAQPTHNDTRKPPPEDELDYSSLRVPGAKPK